MTPRLFVVATPLGNLEDLSPRALRTLRSVDFIVCEDTRRTARLLAAHEISVETLSCHKFNERERLEPVLDRMRRGDTAALVSDAGTPGLADPGVLLVRAALDEGLGVSPIPGPSAVATLPSASGMPADRFVFEGFLPHRGGERRRRLRELRDEPRTIVAFESPHRIRGTLRDIADVLGERQIALGRELTKIHETIVRGTAVEISASLEEPVRGEITLALAPATGAPAEGSATRVLAAWHSALESADGDRRVALRSAARTLGWKKAELYRRLVELRAMEEEP